MPSKRICLSDVKTASELVTEEEHTNLKDGVNTSLFFTSLLGSQAKEHAAEKEDLRKQLADAEDASSQQAQKSKSECEALSKELEESKTAAAKEVQQLNDEMSTLTKQVAGHKQAATKARSQRKKAVTMQRKQASAAAKQTQVARTAARLAKKKNRSLRSGLDRVRVTLSKEVGDQQKRTKEAQGELKAARAELQAAKEVEMEDADPVHEELKKASQEIARLQGLIEELRSAGPYVESHNAVVSPPPSSEQDISMTGDFERESDAMEQDADELDQDIRTDLDAQSLTAFQAPLEGMNIYNGAETVLDPESDQERPARKAKAVAKNPLRRDKPRRSQGGQHSRVAAAGVSKTSGTPSQSGNGTKRPQKSNVRIFSSSRSGVRPSSARPAISSTGARYPWMKAPEKLIEDASSAPIKVPVPKQNAATSNFVLPSDASKKIQDMEVTEACETAHKAYEAGDHAGLRAGGKSGMFYALPSSDLLIFYSPRGIDKVRVIMVNRSDVWEPSKNRYLPAFEEINAVAKDKAEYERACIFAQLPETHVAAARLFEKEAVKKNPEIGGLADRFVQRSPYKSGELWENPKFVGKTDRLFQETIKELSTLPAFQHAAIAWASGKNSNGYPCWPPKFSDPFVREKTTNPKYWVRNELDDLANMLRTTVVDTSADSLLGSLGWFSVDGSSRHAVKSPATLEQTDGTDHKSSHGGNTH